MAILECGASGNTGQEVIEQINDNTANKLPVVGGTMTGNLNIGDGTSGYSIRLRETLDNGGEVVFSDIANERRARMYYSSSVNLINMQFWDDTGTIGESIAFDISGNISVSGAAPTSDNHLTRKDYVDGLITSGTSASKWGSVQTVALNVNGIGIVDPFIVGEVWNNSGVLTVSQG